MDPFSGVPKLCDVLSICAGSLKRLHDAVRHERRFGGLTGNALVAAVYRNETEQLVVAASRLAETHPPVMALREWLLLFVDYIATKHGMYEVLNSIVGGTSDLYSASTAQVKQAMAKLVDRAVASGDIRLDLDPLDLLRALAGVANIGLGPDGERAAKSLVDILIAGIRTRA